MKTKLAKTASEKPCQYDIWFDGMIIESTGYIASLSGAKKYVRARYTKDEKLFISKGYPVDENIKHKVF